MVQDLWWRGLPASIRGEVWKLSAANELNITSGNVILRWSLSMTCRQ